MVGAPIVTWTETDPRTDAVALFLRLAQHDGYLSSLALSPSVSRPSVAAAGSKRGKEEGGLILLLVSVGCTATARCLSGACQTSLARKPQSLTCTPLLSIPLFLLDLGMGLYPIVVL